MGNASAFEMDALDTRIRELIAYARERDGEDRTLLFRNLVDLFLTGKAPKKQPTRDQLLDVIEALTPHVEPDGRRTVAELVAGMSDPPLDLACRLAKDRPHLVGDLLRSSAFDEDDIVELINCTGRDHHHVIASRNDLSANVWIALARAAPVAPAFENQSTLALWRDDLGALSEGLNAETVTPFPTHPAPPVKEKAEAEERPAAAEHIDHAPVAQDEITKTPAVTDRGKAAQLRILRTDKDLIADRIEQASEKLQTRADIEPEHDEAATQDQQKEPTLPETRPAMPHTASLDEPDGPEWRWRSDRDGLVTTVSSRGLQLFDPSSKIIGASILDMLGLNAKLGHPVSRAFQRRSTIHDAPLTLETSDEAHRFWTMEAKPQFSAHGGLFEGYEGSMLPVRPSGESELPLPSPSQAQQPLFREESSADAHAIPTGHDTITDESIDRTIVPPPVSSKPQADTIGRSDAHAAPKAAATSATSPTENLPGKDDLAALASNVIKDLVGESVAEALGNIGSAPSATQKPEAPAVEPNTKPRIELTDELAATLHILEQALSTMVISGQTAKNSALRLQTEIATACLKTLKEQIGATGTESDKE